uniref:Beta-ketoacyl-ACP synthase II n=1 Tax=Solanum tuberosum TaxID=4113 RepID=M1B259_SOLTU
MASSLLHFLFKSALICFTLAEGLLEATSQPSQGRGKVCIRTTLPRPHLWNYIGYVVVEWSIYSETILVGYAKLAAKTSFLEQVDSIFWYRTPIWQKEKC